MAGVTASDTATTTEIDDNDILEALVYQYGGGFEMWNSTALSYTLNKDDANPYGETIGAWTDALTDAIEAAIADIEAISGLSFSEVPDTADGSDGADIDFWYYNNPSDNSSGYSYTVGGSGVYIDEDSVYSGSVDGLAYGGYNYRTVIHELMHNIGIAHPHSSYDNLPGVTSSGDTGDFALNQNLYTVMSYNRSNQVDDNGEETTGWPFTVPTVDHSFGVLGAFDIAIVQAFYGANMSTATGDDIYDIPTSNTLGTYFKSIWDAGGDDTIRYTGSDDATIDLRAATLDVLDGMLAGGIASRADGIYGGFTIANGVAIENAEGGSGADILQGNALANAMSGNDGKDFLYGAGGDDVLNGGKGKDKIKGGAGADQANGNGGKDKIWGGNGQDALLGKAGADRLFGQSGADELFGGAGADELTGGAGRDVMTGGGGADIFIFDSDTVTGRDTITDWQDGVDLIEFGGAIVFADLTITTLSTRTKFSWGANNKLFLDGITSGVSETDFDFV